MKKHVLILPLLLCGCWLDTPAYTYDRTGADARQFHADIIECLKASQQPTHNHEDNNGHIVQECRVAAAYATPASRRCIAHCELEVKS